MFCPTCGQENDEQAQFCQGCGTTLQNIGQESKNVGTKTVAVQYAGFWRRFVAAFLDVTLIFMVLITIAVIFALSRIAPIFALAVVIIPWIYSAIMESSSKQATLGKMLLGIVVTDLEGRRISFAKATVRYLGKAVSILLFFAGFIMAGFSKRKQTLHDMMVGCLVVHRKPNALMQAAQQINSIRNLDQLLPRMLHEIIQVMGAERGFVMLYESGKLVVKATRNIDQKMIASDEFQFSRSVLAEVERSGEPSIIADTGLRGKLLSERIQEDERLTTQTNIGNRNPIAILCLPLKIEEQLIGLIYVDNHLISDLFNKDDLALIMAFINQVKGAIENASLREQGLDHQRLEQEMEDAREMQLSLLPKSAPQIEGFDIAGVCEPATEVGGDYFTYIWMDKEKTKLGIVLMDVTGHGMKAATTTFIANGMLQSEIKSGRPPGEIMVNMHQSLQEILTKNAFVAMSFALLDTSPKILTHFNAGLPTPLLIRNGNLAELDIRSDVPLGCHLPANYAGASVPLLPGDVLLFHSDGLSEAEDAKERMYEYTRMEALLNSLAVQPQDAQTWLDAIVTDVRAFTESGEPEDDLTVVVVRVL